MTEKLEFSIILPVCHGGTLLKNAFESLHQIDFPSDRFEVVVAGSHDDSESRDIATIEAGRSHFHLVYVECNGHERAKKLNAACSVARGRFLAFADDDCVFQRDWLEKLREVLSHEDNVGIVGGTEEMLHNGSAFDQALDSVLRSSFGTGGFRQGKASALGKYYPRLWNMAVPKEVALEVALRKGDHSLQVFDESLNVHEDVDLAERIQNQGKRIVFASKVRVGHKRDTTFQEFVSRNYIMARTARSLHVHRLAHTALTAFVFGMAVLALGSFFVYPLRIVFFVLVVLYATILLGKGIEGLLKAESIKVFALIPLLLVSLHLARGFGYLLPWQKHDQEENA